MVLYTFHVVRTNLTRLSVLIKGDVLISGVVVTDSRGSILHLGSSTVFFFKGTVKGVPIGQRSP